MGDPTGVGPEIILQAALRGAFDQLMHPVVVVGDLQILARAASVIGVKITLHEGSLLAAASHELKMAGYRLPVRAQSCLACAEQPFGQPNATSGRAMADYIEWACQACLNDEVAGMITAPINKHALQLAGAEFPGHTELLAKRCQVDDVVMMLAGEKLKVCLVTTHCSLRDVSASLSVEKILATIRIANDSLEKQFALRQPRLAVLALNPHAGEGGMFGDEEEGKIVPALTQAKAEGIDASGPFSADSLFHFAVRGDYDAVICMYHDQGLIPLKLLHFDDAVNVTLGLPIVRTSVDHGTAYDLAGTGKASPASLLAAVRMADEMASKSNV